VRSAASFRLQARIAPSEVHKQAWVVGVPMALYQRATALGMALSPESIRQYRGTVRKFLNYLGADHPEVQCLDQLRREPPRDRILCPPRI
jgi:hypothetical protein